LLDLTVVKYLNFYIYIQFNSFLFLHKQVNTLVNESTYNEKNYIDGEKGHLQN
jgi:hypothetical protein